MTQTCPRCGLFSPPEAARCDCGYDFGTGRVEASYLASHLVAKHGGAAAVIRKAAGANIHSGAGLLIMAVVAALMSLLDGSRDYYWEGAVAAGGAVLLARGLRQRRRQSLDAGMWKDLR
jgi:hypothetical protein